MTNKQIIEVVQAADAGEIIERKGKYCEYFWQTCARYTNNDGEWNFSAYDYRVKREPRTFYARDDGFLGPVGGRLYGLPDTASQFLQPGCKIIKLMEVIE